MIMMMMMETMYFGCADEGEIKKIKEARKCSGVKLYSLMKSIRKKKQYSSILNKVLSNVLKASAQ
jgi:hypothetical protein